MVQGSPEEESLEWMPQVVRGKLDRVLIKLHLNEWQTFTIDERQRLVDTPCSAPEEISVYDELVVGLLLTRAGKAPQRLSVDSTGSRK